MENLFDECRTLVEEGQLEPALKTLIKIDPDIGGSLLSAFKTLERRYNIGIITDETKSIGETRIGHSILYKLANPGITFNEFMDLDFVNTSNEDNNIDLSCPYCDQKPTKEQIKERKIKCTNCKESYYRSMTNYNVSGFKTVKGEKEEEFKNIITGIIINLQLKKYQKVEELCNLAEALAPREAITWEYRALIHFLPNKGRKMVADQLKYVKTLLKIAKKSEGQGSSDPGIKYRIASLHNRTLNNKLNSIQDNNDVLENLHLILVLLYNWKSCYEITRNNSYLKKILEILSEDNKLLYLNSNQQIMNVVSELDAVKLWNDCFEKMQEIDPAYTKKLRVKYPDKPTELKAGFKTGSKKLLNKLLSSFKN